MIADWYMKYVGTEHEAAPLPWLYQKYAGHDNNRDGFALNLPESQHIAKLMYRDWVPQAYVDHHQMGSGNARLYIPPYAEPIRPDGDPLVWREMSWWGAHMGTKLEAAGKTGVIGAAIYSGWGHMGFHWITPFHNIAGMLTESASARLATPMFLHPDQLRGGPRGLPEYASQTTMPSLWPGGWWRVRDIVEQQKIAAWATVDLAARNRETVLWNMYLKTSRQIERGRNGRVKAYAIAAAQHDPLTARKLVNMLLDSGVEVQQAARSSSRAARLRPGIVRRPDGAAEAGAGALDARPDVLPRQHLHARPRGRPDSTLRHVDRHVRRVHGRALRSGRSPCTADLVKVRRRSCGRGRRGAGRGYVLDGRLNDCYRAVHCCSRRALASAAPVRRRPTGAFAPATSWWRRRRGRDRRADGRELRRAEGRRSPRRLRRSGSRASPSSSATAAATWTRGGRGCCSSASTCPYTTMLDKDVKAGDLAGAVRRHRAAGRLHPGHDRRGPARRHPRRRRRRGRRRHRRTRRPSSRAGSAPMASRRWRPSSQKGGTLVAFGQAGDLPVQRFGLPVRNVVAACRPRSSGRRARRCA